MHGPMMPPYKLQRIWHTSTSFLELRQREVRRIPLPRTPVNKGNPQTLTLSLLVVPQQVESGIARRDA